MKTNPAREAPEASARTVQVWIEPIADDPEAISAREVAVRTFASGRGLKGLRRMRLVEITGALAEPEEVRKHLHESTQFYNPHKERCHVRWSAGDPAPCSAGEHAVLVLERGGDRREAAERWWRHATGEAVKVREGVAWLVTPEAESGAAALMEELVIVRDRRHGLLCNPNAQERREAKGVIPVPWLVAARRARGERKDS